MKDLSTRIIFPVFCFLISCACFGAVTKPVILSNAEGIITGGNDTCIKKKFSIVFYAIQDTAQSRTVSYVNNFAGAIINELNTAFSPICVSFVNCSTVIIPHSPFVGWRKSVDVTVTSGWKTENTINIYLADSILYYPSKEMGGYTHGTVIQGTHFSTKDAIVIATVATPNYTSYAGVAQHTMGHLFGLHDTFSEISIPSYMGSQELVDGSNCATTGDGICDTPADPFPSSAKKDANNQFYTPGEDNYMSTYGTRCRFSPEQYYRMAKYILKEKMYLH